jgi:hypothetical protein
MQKSTRLVLKLFTCLSLLFIAIPGWGACSRTGVTQTEDSRSAQIPFGKINLTDTYFVPVGSLLASVVVPPTNFTYGGATASSVLWECDEADLPGIYFLVATNGDDRVGGFYNIGTNDGLTDVYATWFAYVGLRQTMAGVTLTRYWQKVPVTSYATTSAGRIQIRLQDIPPLHAELYRISTLPGTSAGSSYCGNNNTDGSGIGFASSSGRNYSCTQPNGYIQLSGDSSVTFSFSHDQVGQDSASNYQFWGADNGFGYGMRLANTLYNNPTCVARNADPIVIFPTVSTAELEAGSVTQAGFSVQVECSDSAQSGVAATQTAMGIQVSEGAYSAAQSLGLVNSSGGVSMLVSDNYSASDMAQGVGITLSHSNDMTNELTFVGQPGLISLTPGGNSAGWYPVMLGATPAGSSTSGYTYYTYSFIATLRKINGITVTPGKVHATAYVLVKMQ